MTKTIYIASSLLKAEEVMSWQDRFRKIDILPTYDWAKMYKRSIPPSPIDMLQAVRAADVIVVLLPGGRGAHVELGVALGLHKKIILVQPSLENTIVFYKSPGIESVPTMEDAFNAVIKCLLKG